MLHLTEPQSAWLMAALITLIVVPFLMARVPHCSHESCAEAHRGEVAKARKASASAEVDRLHAFHDRLRPQLACSLCQITPCPVCAGRGGCTPECDCRDCV